MKFKKVGILLILSLVFLLSTNAAYATTYYYLSSPQELEAYGYGADWSSKLTAVVASSGIANVTGVKSRAQVYKNGIKVVDTSKSDDTSPYSVSLSGSESSSSYSNSWSYKDSS
ncbi:hypothetical protein Dtox_0395 [Desulfofarcimen acetoxidans DSM 771]|uniref:Uncharacterized protein n=1 Tax=Desulfofarcimen acetoxidans (strain ATCC 49208 / DSM 771 / KCTC 5769 / VKM B-1644 / 5575) TaxID=485916 RepID=C8W4Y7_DESAS|nr:hypothetical protein [Desulfofarcimen acetoxidans]ACV61339.1 hypothetical protein Dtox_0395 [Desulfofarcimen acetoxidans DSM 771]